MLLGKNTLNPVGSDRICVTSNSKINAKREHFVASKQDTVG